jgi:type II secretory pathway pseudopilin PulG
MRLKMGSRLSRGATLIELAVVLALVGIVGSVIGVSLLRQQRFYRGAGELLGARERVRDAMEVLSDDIRGLATADTVGLMADSAIEFFSNVGSAIVCSDPGGGEIALSGDGGSRGNTLTAFLNQPDSGDFAVFYHAGNDSIAPGWQRTRIAAFSPRSLSTICADSSAFAVGEGGRGFLLTLASPLMWVAAPGTPVRFIRRVRYSLYRASDGEWYLGYRRCSITPPNSCSAIQPVSGPYRRLQSGSGAGMSFRYYDTLGAELVDVSQSSRVARIEIVLRGESRTHVAFSGDRKQSWRDSVVVSVAPRNTER